MTPDGQSPRVMLEAWREQRADRLDPLRFHFIDALERRAADHEGEARRMLDDRLSELLTAYAGDLEQWASPAEDGDCTATPTASARGALAELVDDIASQAAARGSDLSIGDVAERPAVLPAMEVLGDFRKIWSRLRTESQLRQSLEQVPTDAGPLNSGNLVHRSLTLMRELSPGYLQQFMSYVDALSWIEQMNSSRALATDDAPRVATTKKRLRNKPAATREPASTPKS